MYPNLETSEPKTASKEPETVILVGRINKKIHVIEELLKPVLQEQPSERPTQEQTSTSQIVYELRKIVERLEDLQSRIEL